MNIIVEKKTCQRMAGEVMGDDDSIFECFSALHRVLLEIIYEKINAFCYQIAIAVVFKLI